MSLSVVDLPEDGVKDAIVADLEALLVQAKAGELRSLSWYASMNGSTRVRFCNSGARSITETLGRLDILRHELIAKYLNEGDE